MEGIGPFIGLAFNALKAGLSSSPSAGYFLFSWVGGFAICYGNLFRVGWRLLVPG